MTYTGKLFDLIPNLSAIEFTGLARILKVQLHEDKKDEEGHYISRDFTSVLNDVLANFDKQGRQRKREILQIVKRAARKSKDGE